MRQVVTLAASLLLIPASLVHAADTLVKPTIALREPTLESKVYPPFSSEELVSGLETALLATKKFELLSRNKTKLKLIREEQEFSASSFSSGETAHAGKLEAADYLVVPTVISFSFGRSSRSMPNIDSKYFIRDSGELKVDMQVLDSTTGAIKGSFSLAESFGTAERISNSSRGAPSRSHFAKLVKGVAAKFANRLVETVFPTQVLKITGEDIWLNRGAESGLQENEIMVIYRPGESLIDPYTKEDLGTTETELGKIKIIRINPKVSVGTPVSPLTADTIKIGDILRKK